jgi:membrane protein YqaA with SNARE-associated domain
MQGWHASAALPYKHTLRLHYSACNPVAVRSHLIQLFATDQLHSCTTETCRCIVVAAVLRTLLLVHEPVTAAAGWLSTPPPINCTFTQERMPAVLRTLLMHAPVTAVAGWLRLHGLPPLALSRPLGQPPAALQ